MVCSSLVNVTIMGDSLQNTSGCDGCPDACATSQQQIPPADNYVEFTALDGMPLRCLALIGTNTSTDTPEMLLAIRLQAGWAEIRGGRLYRADTSFASGEVFRIGMESGVTKYSKNRTLIYTGQISPPYPLLVDTSILNLGATIGNMLI